jgi:catechol 2,3-dioxygenase-like lactoylglutathione lyase family enzyme
MNVQARPGLELDHTGITVPSLSEALSFWVEVLGFRHLYTWDFPANVFVAQLTGVPGSGMQLAMVERDGRQVELLEYSAPGDRTTLKPRACDVGSVHIALNVDDIDDLVSRVEARGWVRCGPIQTIQEGERAGLRLVYVASPYGFILEFIQPAR